MNTKIDEFKNLCTNKNKMLLTVKKLLHDRLPSPNEAGVFYLKVMEAHLSNSIKIIFQQAETEVKKLFISSLLLKAVLDYPFLITFTNPIPSLEGMRKYIIEHNLK